MENILSFFSSNYIILAVVLILILMAIIGYYAEKTNFGTKPLDEGKKNKKQDIDENKRLNDYIQENMEIDSNIQKSTEEANKVQNISQASLAEQSAQAMQFGNLNQNNIQQPVINSNLQVESANNNYRANSIEGTDPVTNSTDSSTNYNIDEEFSKVISKNNLSDDLTEDIEQMTIEPLSIDNNVSYDKTLSSINIDLPEISDLKDEEDIWKF